MLPSFTCPRRSDGIGVYSDLTDSDRWTNEHCSWCGSMQPEAFLDQASHSVKLGPTDKDYKVYVGDDKFYFQHLNSDQKDAFIVLLNTSKLNLGYPGEFYVLPFFIETTQEQTQ